MAEKLLDISSANYTHYRVSLVNPTIPYDKRRNNAYYSAEYIETKRPGVRVTDYYETDGVSYYQSDFQYYINEGWLNLGVIDTSANLAYYLRTSTHPRYNEIVGIAKSKLFSFAKKGKHSGFNMAVSVAEADKALKTISIASTRIFAFYSALRKGDLGKAYRSLGISQHQSVLTHRLRKSEVRLGITSKTSRIKPGDRRYPRPKSVADNASGYMLETKYGWMPILQDAKAAAEKIASIMLDEPTPLILRARANGRTDTAFNGPLSYVPGINVMSLLTDALQAQFVLRYAFTSEYLSQAASLGLTNPASVIWETVPYSFLVDWFIPIGAYLENLSAFTGLTFLSGCLSTVRRKEAVYSHTGVPTEQTLGSYSFEGSLFSYVKYRTVSTGGFYRYKSSSFVREVLVQFPSPDLNLEAKAFSWSKAAVVASLLQQQRSNSSPAPFTHR